MSNKILFVFEGEKTEMQITNGLTKHFLTENIIVKCAFCNDIYELHKEISTDEDLDTFVLLKNLPANKEILKDYHRNDFAEIYMFFDYDGHDSIADDEKVKTVLHFFDEETSVGKLFISYPMAEALKHCPENIDFKDLKVKAKENIQYKNLAHTESPHYLQKHSKYTKYPAIIWAILIEMHLKKMNFITTLNYSFPIEKKTQVEIFVKQLQNYINVDATVAVLSAFPVFLLDYYGINKMLNFVVENNK